MNFLLLISWNISQQKHSGITSLLPTLQKTYFQRHHEGSLLQPVTRLSSQSKAIELQYLNFIAWYDVEKSSLPCGCYVTMIHVAKQHWLIIFKQRHGKPSCVLYFSYMVMSHMLAILASNVVGKLPVVKARLAEGKMSCEATSFSRIGHPSFLLHAIGGIYNLGIVVWSLSLLFDLNLAKKGPLEAIILFYG